MGFSGLVFGGVEGFWVWGFRVSELRVWRLGFGVWSGPGPDFRGSK